MSADALKLATKASTAGEAPQKQSRLAASAPEPLLLSAREAAILCGVSYATWNRRMAAGQTPTPIRWGGRVLFSREELVVWIRTRTQDGRLLSRREWEAVRALKK